MRKADVAEQNDAPSEKQENGQRRRKTDSIVSRWLLWSAWALSSAMWFMLGEWIVQPTYEHAKLILTAFWGGFCAVTLSYAMVAKVVFDNLGSVAKSRLERLEEEEARNQHLEEKLQEQNEKFNEAIAELRASRDEALRGMEQRHSTQIEELREEVRQWRDQHSRILQENLTLRDLLQAKRHERRAAAKVLVIDDNHDHCQLFRRYLQLANYDVEVAESGVRGLELYDKAKITEPFDLVITDDSMPELTGREVVKLIRSEDSHTRIAILTGHGDHIEQAFLEENDCALWRKPIEQKVFEESLRAVLGK